ncbi:MAG: GNAT family N-acetyltransferase [Candidatus Electrothrix sp. AUS1_2]|nr:GNAT family N-acetyltransferase [Candidatus Electrothrix sp. AUS1_2]
MSQKDKYRDLCQTEPTIPIFSRDWWLDTVCGGPEHWDAAIVEKGGHIVASMPYFVRKKWGKTLLTMPPLTQNLGLWLKESDGKYGKILAAQKDHMQALIDQLPEFSLYSQNWHYHYTNWLPFYWRGFSQKTKYTYVIPELSDEKKLWAGLQENIRREIRKAESRFKLKIRDDLPLTDFLRLNRMTFERQGKEVPYSEFFIRRIDETCMNRVCRKYWIAEDADKRHHAGVYIIWDENSAYYLMGGGNPELRNSGATSLCMWTAIRHAASVTKKFDFEGSMIEPVERFFRAFGAIQTPYFNISQTPSKIIKAYRSIQEFLVHD